MNEPDEQGMVQLAGRQAPRQLVDHIQKASQQTGISFNYLMVQAGKESNFQTDTTNHRSSASGLFQFTKSTWLQLVKSHGAAHGLGDLAEQIHRGPKGDFQVADEASRQKIFDLRHDPELSAQMAGEYARDNKNYLEHSLGRGVDSTDLYMAHFLGPHGAAKVLKARDQNPEQAAATVVPTAARKNPNVFYDKQHSARSVSAVYDKIHQLLDHPAVQVAQAESKGKGKGKHAVDPVAAAPQLAAAPEVAVAPGPAAADPPDGPWPFENGQWPPQHLPPAPPAEGEPAVDSASRRVAYTDVSQSADSISAPMPPASGQTDRNSLGRLFANVKKGLFG